MAFLRKQLKGKYDYYSVVESRRRNGKVTQKILEYLGRDPDPKRLKRAMEYWGVKTKPGRGKRRKR
jgi:hypothetical protein